jgi:hypothetical protein
VLFALLRSFCVGRLCVTIFEPSAERNVLVVCLESFLLSDFLLRWSFGLFLDLSGF